MPTRSQIVDGLRLVYEDDGAGPPLVFFPGGLSSAIQWEEVVPHFVADHRCVVVEQRGHGRSDRSADGAYGWLAVVAEAVEFVRTVIGEPAVLIGQSEGGLIALGVAANRPELVRAVYSEDAVPMTGVFEDAPEALIGFIGRVASALEQSDQRGWSRDQFAKGLAEALPMLAQHDPSALTGLARLFYGCDPAYARLSATEEGAYSADEARRVTAGLRCPVHVARADPEFGALVSEAQVDALRAAGVKVTSTYFPGAGHMISNTHSSALIEDLRTFLACL